jgi:hypothetical protein
MLEMGVICTLPKKYGDKLDMTSGGENSIYTISNKRPYN